jgi:hypothetical protein
MLARREEFNAACREEWSGPRPGGLTLRLSSWGNEVRGWSSLALSGVGLIFFIKLMRAAICNQLTTTTTRQDLVA